MTQSASSPHGLSHEIRLSRAPLAAFASMGMAWGCYAAYVPELKAGIGASDAVFGTVLAIGAAGLMVAMWLAPRFDARLGGRAMPVAAMMLAAAFLLPGLAPGPAAYAAAMLLVAGCSGMLDVVMNARVSEIESRSGAVLMNLNHAGFSLAYAGGALAAGVMREAGLPAVAALALIGLVSLALTRLMRSRAGHALDEGGTVTAPLALPLVLLGGAIVMVAFFVEAATESWSALHVERTLGGGAAEGALGPAMLGLTMGAGRLAGQLAGRRLGQLRLLTGASVLTASGALVAAVAPGPLVAYLGFGALGLGVSVIAPTGLALVGRFAGPGSRTQAMSRVALVGFSGFFVGPVIMGYVASGAGLRVAFAVVSLAALSVPLLAVALERRGAGSS